MPFLRPALLLLSALTLAPAGEAVWPQFRGPGGLGIGSGSPPVTFDAATRVRWQVAVPPGHSSPCIWGERIILTGLDRGQLVTVCLDRADGRELWRAVAPAERIEATHRIGSPAASTPCSDGERVYVYFGSFGLLAYDYDGAEVWRKPLPVPVVEFGTGTSPVVADGKVFLVSDQDAGGYLLAVDARTGAEAWRVDRSAFRRGFSSPFVWRHDGLAELIVAGSIRLCSYDLADGRERWSALGMARIANATPTAGSNCLIVSSWNVGGDEGGRITMAPFAEIAASSDQDHDGTLSKAEFPAGPVKDRFAQVDVDKDGRVTQAEYDDMREMFAKGVNQLFAIAPGGSGDVTATQVRWTANQHLPYVSSPLCYDGRVYTFKNGGLASCYEAATGLVCYQAERLGAPGDYYSSAVAADGRIYIASQQGMVSVLVAGDDFIVLERNRFDEQIFATPAIVDGLIYLRTEQRLLVFGE